MNTSFKRRRLGIAGLICCVLLGGFEIAEVWLNGPQRTDLHSPLGALIGLIASAFTEPPTPIHAGTDRMELVYSLFLGAHMLIAIAFGGMLWVRSDMSIKRSAFIDNTLLALQLLIGLFSMSALLLALAAEFALLLPLRRALKWLTCQVVLLFATALLSNLNTILHVADDAIRVFLFYTAMGSLTQIVTFAVVYLAVYERRARTRLAASHAELLATQSLLNDTVRASERMRIARDLHDIVGHHLTALNLHLDLALRQSDGAVLESLQTSRELARGLLSEVRVVVDAERHDRSINLRDALQTLCAGIPAPEIRLTVADPLRLQSPAIAHALFCCIQEAISNTVRHADAEVLTIDIARRDERIVALIDDDGKGNRLHAEGNGLRGMRERLMQLDGNLRAGNRSPRGYGLEISLPLTGAAQ